MLPSLVPACSAGLRLGLQIPYFPLSTFFARLLLALVCVAFERFALRPVRHVSWCDGLTELGGAGILYKGGQKAVHSRSPVTVFVTVFGSPG